MFSLNKYGITLRPVTENDASLIISIRTDDNKSRFISKTSEDIELQKTWITKYKLREQKKQEYYFIAVDENGIEFATYRVYDIESGLPEIGSWVSLPGYTKPKNSIKVDVLVKEFVFTDLNFEKLKFEVRKENLSVIKYHKLFSPTIYKETEKDIYFTLEREIFLDLKYKLFKDFK